METWQQLLDRIRASPFHECYLCHRRIPQRLTIPWSILEPGKVIYNHVILCQLCCNPYWQDGYIPPTQLANYQIYQLTVDWFRESEQEDFNEAG